MSTFSGIEILYKGESEVLLKGSFKDIKNTHKYDITKLEDGKCTLILIELSIGILLNREGTFLLNHAEYPF